MDMWLSCRCSGKRRPTKDEIASLADLVKKPLNTDILGEALKEVMGVYESKGGDAIAAKSGNMLQPLLKQFPE
jgi:hypothetical protein